MGIPFLQKYRVGSYILKQKILGNKRYPLVLMLEPLFQCNLACAGCGKIDYPDETLKRRLSVQECLDAVDECGVPVVSIAGGEPLIHKEMPQIVEGIIQRKMIGWMIINLLPTLRSLSTWMAIKSTMMHRYAVMGYTTK